MPCTHFHIDSLYLIFFSHYSSDVSWSLCRFWCTWGTIKSFPKLPYKVLCCTSHGIGFVVSCFKHCTLWNLMHLNIHVDELYYDWSGFNGIFARKDRVPWELPFFLDKQLIFLRIYLVVNKIFPVYGWWWKKGRRNNHVFHSHERDDWLPSAFNQILDHTFTM